MKMHRTCPQCKKEAELPKDILSTVDDEEGDLIYEMKCPHCETVFDVIEDND